MYLLESHLETPVRGPEPNMSVINMAKTKKKKKAYTDGVSLTKQKYVPNRENRKTSGGDVKSENQKITQSSSKLEFCGIECACQQNGISKNQVTAQLCSLHHACILPEG